MTDTELLAKYLKGYRKPYLAEVLGLSLQGFYNKLNGKREFRQSEILALQNVLRLSDEERDSIFFASKVDKTATE